ncbi:RraA family protein [Candidatus Acetothermia bacterium]|nr:RraA family protein [Candidatus Acetothermia bacterium]
MDNQELQEKFSQLSTPLMADAILRLKLPVRVAPAGISPLRAKTCLAGRALPTRHYGSVDIFLEAMTAAQSGDILVIDNQGRTDEACIGDLTALEARAYGIAGIIVWGTHRDTAELIEIGLPIFSYGTCSFGPQRLHGRENDALRSARMGDFLITQDDLVFADDDGVLFAPSAQIEKLFSVAQMISQTERQQAEKIKSGKTLHEQLQFDQYLTKRAADPSCTFRKHLREIGGAIEE